MAETIVEVSYDAADQDRFAELSGDINPVHLDPSTGRRSIFGGVAVHGINLVLTALNASLPNRLQKIRSLRAVFFRPVLLERSASIRIARKVDQINCTIESEGLTCTRMIFSVQEANVSGDTPYRTLSEHTQAPRHEEIVVGQQFTQKLSYDATLGARIYPGIDRKLCASDVASLLSCSYAVGMVCPGLQSVFSEFVYKHSIDASDNISFDVQDYDPRYKRVLMAFKADQCFGELVAFVRPGSVDQPSNIEVREFLASQQYSHVRALVIGGSRGIGHLMTKAISIGGGFVCFTFANSFDEASDLQASLGDASCKIEQLDVTKVETDDYVELLERYQINHIFYMATPHIFGAQKGRISQIRLDRFLHYYVAGFIRVADAALLNGVHNIFSPSSSAVEEHPEAMAEYTIAKSAFEVVCEYYNKEHALMNIAFPRLSRFATDQTASISAVPTEDSLATVLSELDRFLSRAR